MSEDQITDGGATIIRVILGLGIIIAFLTVVYYYNLI